jgi:hypothetical protein
MSDQVIHQLPNISVSDWLNLTEEEKDRAPYWMISGTSKPEEPTIKNAAGGSWDFLFVNGDDARSYFEAYTLDDGKQECFPIGLGGACFLTLRNGRDGLMFIGQIDGEWNCLGVYPKPDHLVIKEAS